MRFFQITFHNSSFSVLVSLKKLFSESVPLLVSKASFFMTSINRTLNKMFYLYQLLRTYRQTRQHLIQSLIQPILKWLFLYLVIAFSCL